MGKLLYFVLMNLERQAKFSLLIHGFYTHWDPRIGTDMSEMKI